MKHLWTVCLALSLFASQGLTQERNFRQVAGDIDQRLQSALAELEQVRSTIVEERVPLAQELSRLENEVLNKRAEALRVQRLRDNREVDLNALRTEVQARREEVVYITNLLNEYIRAFESRLHISELQQLQPTITAARQAVDDPNLSREDKFAVQIKTLGEAMDRLERVIGGKRFEGIGIVAGGLEAHGKYVLLGPYGFFSSLDGVHAGMAQTQVGSLNPVVFDLGRQFREPIFRLTQEGRGAAPLDATGGDAFRLAQVEETLIEHIQAGGPVAILILLLAAAAISVAVFKFFEINQVKRPKAGDLQAILNAVNNGDKQKAMSVAQSVKGPFGDMLVAAVEHADEDKELLEEVLYEKIISCQPKLERMIAFIALTAAASPLLGLLGTVTGMITTFRLITVFGTGDARQLSSGISEALVTTELGLIVAIPSLLVQALLSRKAKGTLSEMEQTSVAFVNGLNIPSKSQKPAS